LPVLATLIDPCNRPVHLEIAPKAAHLRELGMSDRAIASALGVSDKTVAKGIRGASIRLPPDASRDA
jgi:transposase